MSEPFIVIMEGPHSSFVFRVPRALEGRVLDVAGSLRVAWGWRVRSMIICDGAGTSWALACMAILAWLRPCSSTR